MPNKKVIIEATLSALGLATAAALIFIPSTRSSSAEPAAEYVEQSGSWTDLDRGADFNGHLEPAASSEKLAPTARRNGDP